MADEQLAKAKAKLQAVKREIVVTKLEIAALIAVRDFLREELNR